LLVKRHDPPAPLPIFRLVEQWRATIRVTSSNDHALIWSQQKRADDSDILPIKMCRQRDVSAVSKIDAAYFMAQI